MLLDRLSLSETDCFFFHVAKRGQLGRHSDGLHDDPIGLHGPLRG
jgi:hypothetical protein